MTRGDKANRAAGMQSATFAIDANKFGLYGIHRFGIQRPRIHKIEIGQCFNRAHDWLCHIAHLIGESFRLAANLKMVHISSKGGGQAVQTVDLNRLGGPVAVSISGLGVLSNPVVWD